MDNIDKTILVLPLLGLLVVVSALYVEGLGYPLSLSDVGILGRFFVDSGLAYQYLLLIVPSIIAVSLLLRQIKGRLDNSPRAGRSGFILLIGVMCFLYVRLTVAFAVNFLTPSIAGGDTSWIAIVFLVGFSALLSLGMYIWRDTLDLVRSNANEAK